LTLAAFAASIYAGRKLYVHRTAKEARHEAEQITAEHEIAMNQDIVELQRTAEQMVIDAEADGSVA
jgi:hypothetical protein